MWLRSVTLPLTSQWIRHRQSLLRVHLRLQIRDRVAALQGRLPSLPGRSHSSKHSPACFDNLARDVTCPQMTFIRSYIDALVHNDNKMLRGAHATGLDRDELARQVMREANYFALASHFMWAVWAIYMAVSTTIKFGYMVRNSKSIARRPPLSFVRFSREPFRSMRVPV